MIRIVLVDDHPVVLSGMAALVSADPGMDVVGSAADVSAAMALADDLAPDVCVVDLQLPDGDGVSLGTALKERWPDTRVLVLTMSADPAEVIRSLGAGLDGYVLKDSDPGELLSAIHAAATGAVVLGRGARAPVVAAAASLPDTTPLSVLDARDREILGLLVRGLTTSQVARQLFLAPKTIRNRISEMLDKLGVATRDDAIALGRAGGLGQDA